MNSTYFKYQSLLTRSTTKYAIWALAILLVGLILTGIATFFTFREVEKKANREFALICNEIKIKTANKIRATAQLLQNGSAFFEASDSVSREDWKTFNQRSKYEQNLPGIAGLGYSMIIPGNKIQQHIQKIRNEGFPNYKVKPEGIRDLYSSVIYLEPFSGSNLRAFGYDMLSDSTRRKAMELARDSDSITLSGKLTLVQNSPEDHRTGNLMYSPVYRKGLVLNTLVQRRQAIEGWVYCVFHINDLIRGILDRWESGREDRIHLQIYDRNISSQSLIYDSQSYDKLTGNPSPSRTITLKATPYNIKWILLFSQPIYQAPYYQNLVKLIFVSGVLISILLYLLTLSLLNTRYRANKIAGELSMKHLESEKRMKEVLENSQDASYKRNLKTQSYEYLSPVFTKISGYTTGQMESLPIEKLVGMIHPEDVDNFNHIIAKSLLDCALTSYECEFRFRQKDGQYRWFQDRFRVVRDTNLQPEAMIGSVSDITDRKYAEEALLQEKLLLRTIIDNIPDSIYCMDLDCRKTLANLTDLHYMGVKSEAEVLGKDDFAFYPREIAEKFFALDHTVIQTGKPLLNCEESLIDGDGVTRYLLSSKLPMRDKDDRIVGLLGIGRDITERKEAEEEVKRKNVELQKLNSAKDKFFSIIAHDLRSPFNGFLGFTQILAEELDTLTSAEIQMIAVNMRDSATTLFRLLENLLEWSRMQQGLITFNPEILLLKSVSEQCLDIRNLMAASKEIEIDNLISDEVTVFADNNMLQTIIRNLVTNSVKFTNRGGKIIITSRTTKDNLTEIAITDNGIGMSRALIDGLFHLEVSTNRTGTEGEASTGLGLIICKDFVEKHGGHLWVESEVGKGSTIHFTIPGKYS